MRLKFFATILLSGLFSYPAHAILCRDAQDGHRILGRLAASPNAAQILSSLRAGPREVIQWRDDMTMAQQSEIQVQQELKRGHDQWRNSQKLSSVHKAYERWHRWSGNAYESVVRMKRLALGERFYRLMRAGDVVRAVNFIRRYFDLRPHAEAMLWAQLRIDQLEKQLTTSSDPQFQAHRQLWISRFKAIVEKEASHLRFYGDMKMIVYQLNRIKIKYDNSIDPRLKSTMIELSQKIMVERVHAGSGREGTRDLIASTEAALARETGLAPLSHDELQKYMNERITHVSGRVSEMPYLRSVFPDLYVLQDQVIVGKKYGTPIEESINLEADFVGAVYHGHFLKELGIRGYGQHLPALATAYRELAWERVGVARNALSSVIKAYGAFARSISRNNLESIIELKESAADLDKEKNDPKYSEKKWMERSFISPQRGFNSLSLANRKLLKWALDQLTIYDALTLHAPKIDILENLLEKTKSGFETRKGFVDMIRTFASSEPGTSSLRRKDFLLSFARIEEYTDVFREAIQLVRAEVKEIEGKPENKDFVNAAAPEKDLLKEMEEAWKLTNKGDDGTPAVVSRISLHTEPNLIDHTARQMATFGVGVAVTVKGIFYAIDPNFWAALKQWIPTIPW